MAMSMMQAAITAISIAIEAWFKPAGDAKLQAITPHIARNSPMGKGDRKTAKGKRNISSYGNARTSTAKKAAVSVAVKKEPVKKAAPVKKAPAKKAASK
jgi:30S ribosomal protein S31